MRLFLDDLRTPTDPTWVVCRTYAEAVAYIEANGQPECVSFDNDLGEPKEGYDLAKWLLLEKEYTDFQWAIHSSNTVAEIRIRNLLNPNKNPESRPPDWKILRCQICDKIMTKVSYAEFQHNPYCCGDWKV